MRHRLYARLYLAFLGITILSLAVTALLAHTFHNTGSPGFSCLPLLRTLACTPARPCSPEMERRITESADQAGIDLAVWDRDGHPVFQAVRSPLPPPSRLRSGWHHTAQGSLWLTEIDDGYMVGLRDRDHLGTPGRLFFPLLGAVMLLMAAGLYPLSRSITRRIEHLADLARRWSEGDLSGRVAVVGKDEIAALAIRFNQAAAAIEALVSHERQMLATASHELRSPLARIRVALELLAEEPDPTRRSELVRRSAEDIVELDALVEELLLAARTQPGMPRRPFTETDLLGLVRGEAEAFGAQVAGTPLAYPCEPAMMKRMVRNLLVNAKLHGQASIRADVCQTPDEAVIAVEDDGPGVPESERERIFAPFYRPPGPRPPGDSGLGLGLALVRQVARYHGGDVRYLPRAPTGSRFEVRLPMPD